MVHECGFCFEWCPLDVFVGGVCQGCSGIDPPVHEDPMRKHIRAEELPTARQIAAYHAYGKHPKDRSAEELDIIDRYEGDVAEEAALRNPDGAIEHHIAGVHVGTVGSRGDFVVDVEKVIELEPGDYGRRFLCRMKERDSGACIVWFTGENLPLEEAASVTIRATVKAHEVYQGRRQTVVQRAKVVEQEVTSEKPIGP